MERSEFQKLWEAFEIITIGCVLFGILLFLYLIRGLLTPFIIAFIITFFLSPVVDYMEREGINRTLAVTLLILLTLFFLFILWKLTWPIIQTEITSFQKNAPFYVSEIRGSLGQAMKLLETKAGFIPEGTMQRAIQQKISDLMTAVGNLDVLFKTVRYFSFTFVLTQLIVFFFLKDGRRIRKGLIAYVPNKYFETFLNLIHEIDNQISNYIRGQLTDALFVGVLTIVGLYLFGISYAIFIGVIAGIANIVPYVGPLLALTFGGLLVLIDTGSITNMIKAMGILAFVKLLDSTAIAPLAVGKRVNVHPLMVIIVISVGGLLHGIWGMLLSVPLYCSMRVSLRILYRGFVEYGNW
ncbi:MAG TPA: AI-2E family transporter [Dissulfurispiraceae bacterium]|nr:AI-2E family transporter [Dissulfurispiraceae bacterium]